MGVPQTALLVALAVVTGCCDAATTSTGGVETTGSPTSGSCSTTTCAPGTGSTCCSGYYCNDGHLCFQLVPNGGECVQGYGYSCASGVSCLVPAGAQTGFCCQSACATSDATCGAKECDTSGACVYPDAGLDCGAPSCMGGVLTLFHCSGSGTCVDAGQECPGGNPCSSATSC